MENKNLLREENLSFDKGFAVLVPVKSYTVHPEKKKKQISCIILLWVKAFAKVFLWYRQFPRIFKREPPPLLSQPGNFVLTDWPLLHH